MSLQKLNKMIKLAKKRESKKQELSMSAHGYGKKDTKISAVTKFKDQDT